jgi:hypothetical protein
MENFEHFGEFDEQTSRHTKIIDIQSDIYQPKIPLPELTKCMTKVSNKTNCSINQHHST